MKRILIFLFSLLNSLFLGCQNPPVGTGDMVKNPAFEKELNRLLDFSVPILSVEALVAMDSNALVLDARERKEYEVSHIPGASYIGYAKWDEKVLDGVAKNQPVVLYCSVGYRSAQIGKKLQKLGFTKVYNLYGSIFEWVNQGNPLEDIKGENTTRIHTYNKNWSQWVENEAYHKEW